MLCVPNLVSITVILSKGAIQASLGKERYMPKSLFEILFALAMLAIGVIALFFTNQICSVATKISESRKGLFDFIGSEYTSLSIRFGGVIAVFLGLFVLWMCWRNH